MSTQTNKSDYLILITLAVFTFAILLTMAIWGYLSRHTQSAPGVCTTFSNNVDAVRIYYTLLEKLGYPANRLLNHLNASELDGTGTLLLLEPLIPLKRAEIKRLRVWLENGGVLITTKIIPELRTDLEWLFIAPPIEVELLENGIDLQAPDEKTEPKPAFRIPAAFPLARDVNETHFKNKDVIQVDCANADDLCDIGHIESLFADNHGIRIIRIPFESGSIILVADISFLTNGFIHHSDNALLATNLIAYGLSKTPYENIGFDEYHLGQGRYESGFDILLAMLFHSSAGWAVLCVTIASILFLVYKGRRFGPRYDLPFVKRRSMLEYIDAIGATYHAAGANRLTLEIIFKWFKGRIATSIGLDTHAPETLIYRLLAKRDNASAEICEDGFRVCHALLEQPKISEAQLSKALTKLIQVESEVFYHVGKSG